MRLNVLRASIDNVLRYEVILHLARLKKEFIELLNETSGMSEVRSAKAHLGKPTRR